MLRQSNLKLITRLAAVALLGASLIFLFFAVRKNWATLDAAVVLQNIPLILAGGLVWAGALFVQAFAWSSYVARGQSDVRYRLILQYGLGNIAKYLPGNVLHFAARQAAVRAENIPQWRAVAASVGEIIGLSSAALVLGGAVSLASAGSTMFHKLQDFLPALPSVGSMIVAAAIAAVLTAIALRHFPGQLNSEDLRRYLIAGFKFFLSSVVYFALIASIVLWLSPESGVVTDVPVFIAGAYLLAWLVGYVLPGASAGIGVREAAFLIIAQTGASGAVDEPALLVLITLLRLVNILGDLFNFTLCTALQSRALRQNTGKQ